MSEAELLAALKTLFPQAEVSEVNGTSFWFAPGDGKKLRPFLTLVTTDEHDRASNLSRPGVYRLNLGLTPAEYQARFGPPPKPRADWGVLDTGFDSTQLDTLMPHPIYAPMGWVCILNPSPASFEKLVPQMRNACERAARRG